MVPTTMGPAEEPRRSHALPSPVPSARRPGGIKLGGIEIEREGDRLHNGVGEAGEDQHLHGRGGPHIGQRQQRQRRAQESGRVPPLAAHPVDEQGAADGGDDAGHGG